MLLSGRLGQPVAVALADLLPQVSVRVREHPDSDDVGWAQAYTGFMWPQVPGPVAFEWVHAMGAGVDDFVDHSSQIGLLTRTIGGMPERMGTFVLALLLDHAHHLTAYAEAQRRRQWRPLGPAPLPSRAVVLGTGQIASGIARALGLHGVHVTGVNRSGRLASDFDTVYPWRDIDAALDGCQVLISALPASPATKGIISDTVLGSLRETQFINVGRGSTVDLSALQSALTRGSVVQADLDVFEVEPLEAASWLWAHPQVRITPHVGALSTVDDVVEAIATTFAELARGVRPPLHVDLEGEG
ncbi:hypothetical protein ASD06_08510 [Angustibacter sp. Root456]|nr:hypothetical protein ASD06_08510 [Angustibacter sp. Root456]